MLTFSPKTMNILKKKIYGADTKLILTFVQRLSQLPKVNFVSFQNNPCSSLQMALCVKMVSTAQHSESCKPINHHEPACQEHTFLLPSSP